MIDMHDLFLNIEILRKIQGNKIINMRLRAYLSAFGGSTFLK